MWVSTRYWGSWCVRMRMRSEGGWKGMDDGGGEGRCGWMVGVVASCVMAVGVG